MYNKTTLSKEKADSKTMELETNADADCVRNRYQHSKLTRTLARGVGD